MSTAEQTPPATAETVEWLCAQGERRSGSDVERRIAAGLAERLRSPRRRAIVESIYVHPQWQLVYLAHGALALSGSLLAGVEPGLGFALVLIATTSFYLDAAGRFYLLRSLFFRRASQNVVSPPIDESERPRVILTAGYDAGLTGVAYNRWAADGFERLQRLWPGASSAAAVIFWAMALLLPVIGLRMAGIDEGWVAALQLPQTLVLLLAAFMLGEIGLSPVSPAAAHNGSGVAAALAVAAALDDEPPEGLEVTVLLVAASQAGGEGMRAFLRSHGEQLPCDRTWFVEISSVGAGDPRFVESMTHVLSQPLDPELLEICDLLAAESGHSARLSSAPAGAAAMAAGRGYPALALTAREGSEVFPHGRNMPTDRPEAVHSATIDAVSALAVDALRLLDRNSLAMREVQAPPLKSR